jgi:hypothetical protein
MRTWAPAAGATENRRMLVLKKVKAVVRTPLIDALM